MLTSGMVVPRHRHTDLVGCHHERKAWRQQSGCWHAFFRLEHSNLVHHDDWSTKANEDLWVANEDHFEVACSVAVLSLRLRSLYSFTKHLQVLFIYMQLFQSSLQPLCWWNTTAVRVEFETSKLTNVILYDAWIYKSISIFHRWISVIKRPVA